MSDATPITPKPKKSVALSGVTAGNTALCTVGRTGNDLHYRGYDILDFAETAEFEEIAYLLVHGKLPTKAELASYKRKLKALRGIPSRRQGCPGMDPCHRPTRWTCCVPRARRSARSCRRRRTTMCPAPATSPTA